MEKGNIEETCTQRQYSQEVGFRRLQNQGPRAEQCSLSSVRRGH